VIVQLENRSLIVIGIVQEKDCIVTIATNTEE